jgi:hypothetical protein
LEKLLIFFDPPSRSQSTEEASFIYLSYQLDVCMQISPLFMVFLPNVEPDIPEEDGRTQR